MNHMMINPELSKMDGIIQKLIRISDNVFFLLWQHVLRTQYISSFLKNIISLKMLFKLNYIYNCSFDFICVFLHRAINNNEMSGAKNICTFLDGRIVIRNYIRLEPLAVIQCYFILLPWAWALLLSVRLIIIKLNFGKSLNWYHSMVFNS